MLKPNDSSGVEDTQRISIICTTRRSGRWYSKEVKQRPKLTPVSKCASGSRSKLTSDSFEFRSKQGTVSSQKHELLFSRFGINYDKTEAMFRRGTILLRPAKSKATKTATAQEAGTNPEHASNASIPASGGVWLLHEALQPDSWWTKVDLSR